MAKKSQFLEFSTSVLSSWVGRAMCSAKRKKLLLRLWDHDYTLWSDSPDEIENRLGWLNLPESMQPEIGEIDKFVGQAKADGFDFALLLGMGGSSLAPDVFRRIFDAAEGYLNLAVLDSTDPQAVLAAAEKLDYRKTLFIVSTKSGGTVETLSFFKYFYNQTVESLGEAAAGKHFIAITDPGSKLENLAKELNFRHLFLNDPNLGGRYSALSHFGLVPAALIGMDITQLLDNARQAAEENGPEVIPSKSQAAQLGTLLAKANKARRDKVTFISDPALAPFEDWVEQLIAESTGKSGKAILPVTHEPIPNDLEKYGNDRVFVFTHLGDDKKFNQMADELSKLEHPCVHLRLKDQYELGKLIFVWEMAIAVAGREMYIHPFNQPNVESAKVLARESVAAYQETGTLPHSEMQELTSEAVEKFLEGKKSGAYISLQAYIQPTEAASAALHRLQAVLRDKTGMAVTVGYGPRFLHSTGQLHKGGKGNGVFVQFISDPKSKVDIPKKAGEAGSFIDFGVLKQAQAIGDAQALTQAGRRVIAFAVEPDPVQQIDQLIEQLG
jgi:transaldolase/glucose-6-phosphate isomerase